MMRWQTVLQEAIRDPHALLEALQLTADQVGLSEEAMASFSCCVPKHWLGNMRVGDPDDPLLWQVLPRQWETQSVSGFVADPLGEQSSAGVPGLLHKYQGRVLLTLTQACPIHCRYCFRRHFPYRDQRPRMAEVLSYLHAHPEVHEILFSGGDPLMLGDEAWASWVSALNQVPHLRRLRVHTRMPSVVPERLTSDLLAVFGAFQGACIVVSHMNHADECSVLLKERVRAWQQAGVTWLNQSVLLRRVNDDALTLAALSEALFEHGILPYYLHVLDPVDGAAHFEVGRTEAQALMRALRARLPGYLVPRLVWEKPGADAKVVLG